MYKLNIVKVTKNDDRPGYNNHVEISKPDTFGFKTSRFFYAESTDVLDWTEKPITEEQARGLTLEQVESKKNPGQFYWRLKKGF